MKGVIGVVGGMYVCVWWRRGGRDLIWLGVVKNSFFEDVVLELRVEGLGVYRVKVGLRGYVLRRGDRMYKGFE